MMEAECLSREKRGWLRVLAKREPGKNDDRTAGPSEAKPPGIVLRRFGAGVDHRMRRRRPLRYFDLFHGRRRLRLWVAMDGPNLLPADGSAANDVRAARHGHRARARRSRPPALLEMGTLGRL